jgi:hypothetical protein
MEIKPPLSPTPAASTPARAVPPMRPGEILGAVVQARLPDNRFLLQLAPEGRSLTAYSQTDLEPGRMLKLEVVKPGSAGLPPELRLIPDDHRPAGEASTIQQALRQFLPKQEPLAALTAALSQLPGQGTETAALPRTIREAIGKLLATVPQQSRLTTPEGLKEAVRNSGLFLEAKLLAGAPPEALDSDLKARLLRLLDALKPVSSGEHPEAPNTRPRTDDPQTTEQARLPNFPDREHLAHKAENALAKLVMDQLASLPKPDGPALAWQLEIPFAADGRHNDAAQLLVTRDGRQNGREGETECWSVTVELHPPGMGAFCGRIVWNNGRIDAYLWSDRPATAELMRAYTDHLQARLQHAGLEVGHLTTLDKAPNPRPTADRPALPLLDLRA